MDFFFNNSIQQLNASLFTSIGQAASARTVQVALAGRNSGPSGPVESRDQAALEARARESIRVVEGFTKLTIKQKRAVKTLEKTTERLGEMKALLLEARELIVKAQSADTTAETKREFAKKFDQLIGKYNLRAKGAGHLGTNLIGSSIRDIFDANDLTVPIKPKSLATTTYQGNFLGADYVITDGSGDIFLPNIFGSTLIQFPPPDENDTGTLLQSTDTVAYDSTTGAVSITREGEGTPILEGTLERKGVGVLHSYFYGSFEDETLRDTALDDITKSLSSLRFNIAMFDSQKTRAEVALKFSEGQIEENKGVAARVEAEKFANERRFSLEEQKRQILFERSLTDSLTYGTTGLAGILQKSLLDFEI